MIKWKWPFHHPLGKTILQSGLRAIFQTLPFESRTNESAFRQLKIPWTPKPNDFNEKNSAFRKSCVSDLSIPCSARQNNPSPTVYEIWPPINEITPTRFRDPILRVISTLFDLPQPPSGTIIDVRTDDPSISYGINSVIVQRMKSQRYVLHVYKSWLHPKRCSGIGRSGYIQDQPRLPISARKRGTRN